MPAFINFDGVDGEVNDALSEANVEVTVKVPDAGGTFYGAMTDVDLAIRVVDTDTGQVTERESGLIYSGESGGMNESGTDVRMPDLLVSSWQTGGAPDRPFFACDASFRGGVDVPAASQGSGYAGQLDIASFGWGAETSAAEASGPMKESMETMKKAWKDASSTPEGAEHAAGANWAFGDGSVRDAAGPFVAYGDGFMGGVFVGASDAVPNGRLYLATDVGVFEQGAGGGDLNDWQSHYGTGGWAAASGGGGDDVLIGGLTGFEPLPGQLGFDLV